MNGGPALPNVGPGPDPLSISALEADFVVLLLHRDFYCSECRQQVRRVKNRYAEFEALDAEVLSVLPEDRETAKSWQKQYHLPFPVLVDADKQWGKHYDQPRKYGLLGRIHDIIGLMPAAIVLDLRAGEPTETFAHRGNSKTDRPRVDELLAAIEAAAAGGANSTTEQRETTAPAVEPAESGLPPETSGGGEATGAPETVETVEADETSESPEATAATEAAAPPETDETDGDGVEPTETVETAAEDSLNGDGEAVERSAESVAPAADDGGPEIERAAEANAEDETKAAEESPRPVRVPDSVTLPSDVELRRAVEEDAMAVIRVLHGALLEIDGSTVREAVDRGDVIVADADGWVVGALVLEDNHIDTLAVRREHRKQGLGSALVETAVAEIGGPVTADFRAGVRGFWANLDFEIEREGARFYGIRR